MIKSKYDPESGKLGVWNYFKDSQRLDYSLIDLDSNLCFGKGWVLLPPGSYYEFIVWDPILPCINQVGVRLRLFEEGKLVYSQDHYVVDKNPENYFYSNDLDIQYGSWYSLIFENEYGGLITLSDNEVIYDLGANIGVFTKWVLNQINPQHVYAFEPTPDLIPNITKTFNSYPNVTIFDKAIAGKNKTAKFFTFENSVSNTLLDFEGKNETYQGSIDVECVNLEQFIHENNLLLPTIIKMDIESAEYDSIENLSDEFILNIKQFIVEYHDNVDGRIWQIIKKFLNLGFEIKLKPGTDLTHLMGTIVFVK